MYIYLLGHCEKCDHILTRAVKVRLDDADLVPCECPECHEGTVHFERLAVDHWIERKTGSRALTWALGAILLLAVLFAGACLYANLRLHRGYTPEEVAAAVKEAAPMSSADILGAFREDGIREESLSRILGASRFTLKRIGNGESRPTPAIEASIKGLYTDYLLLGKSRLLFALRYRLNGMDPAYAFINPLQEEVPTMSMLHISCVPGS